MPGSNRRQLLKALAVGPAAAVGFLGVNSYRQGEKKASRAQRAYQMRLNAAKRLLDGDTKPDAVNGEEGDYPDGQFSFARTLPHRDDGEFEPTAYRRFVDALSTSDGREPIARALGGSVELSNPRAAYAFSSCGADAHSYRIPPPPHVHSDRAASELIELQWQAHLRDVSFADYASQPSYDSAVNETASQTGGNPSHLFRGLVKADQHGPFISQFLYATVPHGVFRLEQRFRRPTPGLDYLTKEPEWLMNQRGAPQFADIVIENEPRYIWSGRDLAYYVYRDYTFQAFLDAALVLQRLGPRYLASTPYDRRACPSDPASPPLVGESSFVTFGQPHILDAVCAVANLALQASWYQKWLVHRRLRPEVMAHRVATVRAGSRRYPISDLALESSVYKHMATSNAMCLLPMAYPDGSPTHPSYPAGHAVIAGACATVLKAFHREELEFPAPVIPTDEGRTLIPYQGVELTVGAELDKLASNIAVGRQFGGVHFRSDGEAGLRLGEAVALSYLRDCLNCVSEDNDGLALTSFEGEPIRMAGTSAV